MKIQKTLTLLVLTAAASVSFAKSIDANKVTHKANVSYSCQQGKRLNVSYGFNANGIPVYAAAKINGAVRTMKYDMANSDAQDVNFKDKNGFSLGADGLERKTVRRADIVTVTNSQDEILFKNCSPRR